MSFNRHPFARYFKFVPYDTTVNTTDRLWATDNVYYKKDEKINSKYFFRSSIENLKTQLLKLDLNLRDAYEFIIGGVATRLYFDIENHVVDIKLIVRHAFAFTKFLGWKVKFHMYQLDSSDETKFSRHIIIRMIQEDGTELFFKDVCSVGAFVRRCFARLPEDDPVLKAIDFGVYTNNRQFRIGGCGKNGGKRYLCFMKNDEERLSPEDTLKTFDRYMVQDHSIVNPQTIEVAEENGLTGQSIVRTIDEYRKLWFPAEGDQNIPLEDLSHVIKDRKRKLKLQQTGIEKRQRTIPASLSSKSFQGPLLPSESLFETPSGYEIEEPLNFFESCLPLMTDGTTYSVSEYYNDDELLSINYSRMSINLRSMSKEQKTMLACINANIHKNASSMTFAEQVAFDFIGKNAKSSKTLGEMCATWLMDLTLDTQVTLIQTIENGFVFSCPRTHTCHKKGADHMHNKIYFVFDVMNAIATQQCHDTIDCGSKAGVQIILPLKIRYTMFLVQTWKDLYLKTFF